MDLAEGHIKKLIEHAEQAFEEQTCGQLGVDNPFLFRQLALHPQEQIFSPIRPKDLVSQDGEDDVGSDRGKKLPFDTKEMASLSNQYL